MQEQEGTVRAKKITRNLSSSRTVARGWSPLREGGEVRPGSHTMYKVTPTHVELELAPARAFRGLLRTSSSKKTPAKVCWYVHQCVCPHSASGSALAPAPRLNNPTHGVWTTFRNPRSHRSPLAHFATTQAGTRLAAPSPQLVKATLQHYLVTGEKKNVQVPPL